MVNNTRLNWSDIRFERDSRDYLGKGYFSKVVKGIGTEYLRIPGKAVREPRELELAVKILEQQNPNVKEQVLFMRQVEIGCGVDHPAVLGFLGFSIFPYAIAMERCVIDLRKVLEMDARGYPFSYRNERDGTVVRWNDTTRAIAAFGIAVGMCCLHDHGIVHRNLKADNIMLDENLYPRISGFGFSKILGPCDEMDDTMITNTMDVGTPMYMAPERLSEFGDGRYSHAVDVFSYAMVLYELVTMTVPWENVKGYAHGTIFNMIIYLEKGLRPTIPDYIPAAYKQLIEKCWAQNPHDRPTFRQIVTSMQGEEFFFHETDISEVHDYQERMLETFNV
jgi:serine/threonine protein kinase